MVEAIGGNAAARLLAFVERIERLDEEAANLGDDRKEVYAEAKSTGFDTKILKLVVKRRRMDPADRQEDEALLETYERALAEAASASHTPAPVVPAEERQGGAVEEPTPRPAGDTGNTPEPGGGETDENEAGSSDQAGDSSPASADDDLLDTPPLLDRREEADA